jgi:hypothetical protein
MQRMVSFIVVELVVKAVIWNIFSSGRLVLANPRRELLRWKRKASRGVLAHSRRARESPSLASSRTVVPERYHVPVRTQGWLGRPPTLPVELELE